MCKFYKHMTELKFSECNTCKERSPGLKLASVLSECTKCANDHHQTKLYSSMYNMDPGPVPQELQVLVDFV